MTRQVPEPGQGIIMMEKEIIEKRMKEKMDGSMFIGTWWSLVAAAACNRACVFHKARSVQLPVWKGVAVGALLHTGFSPGFFV